MDENLIVYTIINFGGGDFIIFEGKSKEIKLGFGCVGKISWKEVRPKCDEGFLILNAVLSTISKGCVVSFLCS